MTADEYSDLCWEISETKTLEEVDRLRDRILTFPDDHFRLSLLRSLGQHAADLDLI